MIHLLATFNLGKPDELGLPTVGLATGANVFFSTVFILIGAAAVIWLLLFGALPYAMSNGEPAAIKRAKDVIVNAVIGLVVSLLGFAIVNFITSKVH